MKIKVSDQVLVITGKYKGKTGKVIKLYRKQETVTIEKINIRTKHIKKTATAPGDRITFEAPFDASNVAIICPHCSKATRVGYIKNEGEKKQRICKKCEKAIDTKAPSKKSSKSK